MSEKMVLRGNITPISYKSTLSGYYTINTNLLLPKVLLEGKLTIVKSNVDVQLLNNVIFIDSFKPDLVQGDNIYSISADFSHLTDGDIISISSKNKVSVVFRKNANANFLLLTEQCDNFCIMCSQPPKDIADEYIIESLYDLIPLLPQQLSEIGLSGGEPTILKEKFIKLLRIINAYLPRTAIHVLSNGKSFDDHLLNLIVQDRYYDLMFGIPLYSHDYQTHDYIVQSKGAFNKTVHGICNLKKYRQKIEIRVVIQKENYNHLIQLADYIVRNLQFVDQVVFMGLEMTGFARGNANFVWIEPILYQEQLKVAIQHLTIAKVKSKIYNHQLCLLDSALWKFNTPSISDWKNTFLDECNKCHFKSQCGGFFATSDTRVPSNIKAIVPNNI